MKNKYTNDMSIIEIKESENSKEIYTLHADKYNKVDANEARTIIWKILKEKIALKNKLSELENKKSLEAKNYTVVYVLNGELYETDVIADDALLFTESKHLVFKKNGCGVAMFNFDNIIGFYEQDEPVDVNDILDNLGISL